MEEEVKVKKVKSNKGLIVFLLLIIFGLVGYIAYDKMYLSTGNSCNIENNTENNDNNEENENLLDVDSKEVEDIMESFTSLSIRQEDLYKYGKYSINTITDYDLIATSIKNIDSKNINYCIGTEEEITATITIKDLNEALSKYILNRSIKTDMILENSDEVSYPIAQYEINNTGIIIRETSEKEEIILIGSCGAEGPQDYIERKIIKVEVDGDYVYIHEKEAFATYSTSGEDEYLYYNNYAHDGKYKEAVGYQSVVSLNWDLYNTYKYTFKKVDDKYYFQSFELEV